MNKSKRLLSLICAIAMMISVFAGFTVVSNAEVTTGIQLVYDTKNSTATEKVVLAKYVGVDGIQGSTVELAIPADLAEKIEKIEGTTTLAGLPAQSTMDQVKASGTYVFTVAGAAVAQLTDNVIVTIKITLKEGNAEDIPLEFVAGEKAKSSIDDGVAPKKLKNGDMQVEGTVLARDPNAPTPVPTTPPRPTQAPTPEEVTTGIELSYDAANSTETKKVILAKYVGVDGIQGSTVELAIPADLAEKIEKIEGTTTLAGLPAQSTMDQVKASGTYVFTVAGAAVAQLTDNVIVTITITLKEANAESLPLEFVAGEKAKSSIDDGVAPKKLKNGDMQVKGVTVPVYSQGGSDVPSGNKYNLKDYAPKDAAEGEGGYYLTVDITKKDGTPAKYGEDFVAVYDGKALTVEEYTNLISGYTDEALADVIAGLQFVDVNGELSSIRTRVTPLNAEGEPGTTTDSGDKTFDTSTPAPTKGPKQATLTTSATSYTVAEHQVVVIKPVLKIDGKEVKDAAFYFDYAIEPEAVASPEPSTSPSPEYKTYTSKKKAYEDEVSADKAVYDFVGDHGVSMGGVTSGVESAKVTGIKGNNRKNLYVWLDSDTIDKYFSDGKNGLPAKYPLPVDINVTKATSGNGSGSGSGSGTNNNTGSNGPIAGPGTSTPNTPNVPGIGGNYYIDLDSVPWAETAINAMTAKGMLDGYGDYTFRPYNNITRAEFAKMVVTVFGVPAATGGPEFEDVASGSWYYPYVEACAAAGIVNGYPDGKFDPYKTIARQEMAVMVYRGAMNMGKSNYLAPVVPERVFVDEPDIADYAKEAVKVLQMAGVISGMDEYHYCPVENATRAQSAVMLYPFAN